MASAVKRAVAQVLQTTLGEYIEGIDPASLNVGLWAGKIELSDLRLRPTAVAALAAALAAAAAAIGRLPY